MINNISKLKEDIAFNVNLRGFEFEFRSTWGLFSPKNIDEGSLFLINNIEIRSTDINLDVGCGYGSIGLALAKLSPKGITHLIDKDFVAVEYAKRNAEINSINNCECYLSNGLGKVPNIKFDNVVSNLPAKTGKELYSIIFEDSFAQLKLGGKIYVVTISALRDYIKRSFQEIFGNYEKIDQGKNYTVGMAIRK